MEAFSMAVVGVVVVASFLYAVWPLFQPPEAAGVLPEEEYGGPTTDRMLTRLLMERDRAYKNILDIEFDKEMGKLSEEDYAQMIVPARAQAMEVLRRLEARGVKEGVLPVHLTEKEAVEAAQELSGAPAATAVAEEEHGLDARLEAEIVKYRKVKTPEAAVVATDGEPAPAPKNTPSPARFCPSCGNPVGQEHNFCASCGFKLK